MFSKSTLVGTLVGFVYLFFSGWFFYDYIAADFFSQHQLNSTVNIAPDMNYITFGVLVQAYVISLIYSRWGRGDYRAISGFRMGALMGVFVGLGMNMISLGTLALIDFEAAVVDGVWSMVNFGIAGALNGWIFRGFN